MGDEVRVALYDPLEHDRVGEIEQADLFVDVLQVQDDSRAAALTGRIVHRELTVTVRAPQGSGVLAGPSGHQLHTVCDHERRVEANPELSNQLGHDLAVATGGGLAEQLAGARLGNRPDVVDDLLAAHADSAVVHSEHPGLAVWLQTDLERMSLRRQRSLADRLEPEPIQGIRGVRDQLAQEDLLVGVQRVDDNVEELTRLSSELVRLRHDGPLVVWSRALGIVVPAHRHNVGRLSRACNLLDRSGPPGVDQGEATRPLGCLGVRRHGEITCRPASSAATTTLVPITATARNGSGRSTNASATGLDGSLTLTTTTPPAVSSGSAESRNTRSWPTARLRTS